MCIFARTTVIGILAIIISTAAPAAEFTWYSDVQGREGWIEFAKDPTEFQNRIHVFPRVNSPSGSGTPKIEGREDGVVITMEIDTSSPSSPLAFTNEVLARVASDVRAVGRQYQINVPRPRGVTIAILRDGRELARREITGQIPSSYIAQISALATGQAREAMLRGEFQLETSFELPTGTFSSIGINVQESLLTSYKIQAMQSMVTRSSVSGGKFLFFDWRRRSARTIIQKSIEEQRDINTSRQTSVITIDPDQDMIERVEAMLGISQMSKEEMVSRHLAAAERAAAAGNHDLAALHRDYAVAADDPTPRVSVDLLQEAFAALAGNEPAIGAFLANGIQFSSTSSSTKSQFYGFGRSDTSYFGENGYAEMKIKTALVRYTVTSGPFSAVSTNLRDCFGVSDPNESAATTGLFKAIQSADNPCFRAALSRGAKYNMAFGLDRETPLIMAARACNAEQVQALLQAGANPFLRDGKSRSAEQVARLSGCASIADTIEASQ